MLYKGDKDVSVAARPLEGGPAETRGLSVSSLPWSNDRLAQMPDSPLNSQWKNWAEICALLVIGSPEPKISCKLVIICHGFTKYNVWFYVCYCFSSIYPEKKCNVNPCLTMLVNDSWGQMAKGNLNLYLDLIPPNQNKCSALSEKNRRCGEPIRLIFTRASHQVGFDTRPLLKCGLGDDNIMHEPIYTRCWSYVHPAWSPVANGSLFVIDSQRAMWIYARQCLFFVIDSQGPKGLVQCETSLVNHLTHPVIYLASAEKPGAMIIPAQYYAGFGTRTFL